MQNTSWQFITDKNINYKEREEILKIIIKDKPVYLADVEPKFYNKEINVIDKLKTLKGWQESGKNLLDYLKIGDEVDKELLDYFINELPPRTLNGEIVQIGGADSSDKYGRDTYITFATENPFGSWYYKGSCLPEKIINEVRSLEEFDMSYLEEDLEEEILEE